MAKKLAQSRESAAKTMHATLQILKKAGGQLSGSEVIKRIEEQYEFTEWEKIRYAKTGNIRWQSILQFFTIDLMKAGFLLKEKGNWILTEEGDKATKLSDVELYEKAHEAYVQWATINKKAPKVQDSEDEIDTNVEESNTVNIEQLESKSVQGIIDYINKLNPYEFQDLVASLLRGMGHYINYVAERGKDGGVDIWAYSDPLGSKPPRIKVQVKHKPEKPVPADDIRKLQGILGKGEYVGLFVTSGYFSSTAINEARTSNIHVELIDISRFIELWKEFYSKMKVEDQNRLPIHPIYFLGSAE